MRYEYCTVLTSGILATSQFYAAQDVPEGVEVEVFDHCTAVTGDELIMVTHSAVHML